MSGDLIDTTEMYLRTILELIEEGQVPLRARIAERLGQSGPTVSQTVARMERDGLLVVGGDRHLQLTTEGQQRAVTVMRRHRLAECLLVDVIGLDWEHVHEEACRWEHVMSDQVERKVFELLGRPTMSPYGNPIPGLTDLLEGADSPGFRDGLRRLVDATDEAPGDYVIHRLGEPLQSDPELLTQLTEAGVRPGLTISASRVDKMVTIQVDGVDALELRDDVAGHIFVAG